MMKITAYTDGSAVVKCKRIKNCIDPNCPKCQLLGGIGGYIQWGSKEYFISKGYKNTTISRMEMTALLYVIRKIPLSISSELTVYSDSQFVVNSFNKGWLEKWKQENFLGRKNSDIWKEIYREINIRKDMKFKIIHTRGHLKDMSNPIVVGNTIADELANYKIHKSYELDLKIKENVNS